MSATVPAERKRCFEPVVDERTRVLVLGSLPSEKSLALGQYYGNPQNKFWLLISDVLDVDMMAHDYPARLRTLLANGVGLWDVVSEAERPGSLDSSLRAQVCNDLLTLAGRLPQLNTVAFNGGTAARLGGKQLGAHGSRWQLLDLPSSSPAFTLPYARKLERWLLLREALPAAPGVAKPSNTA